MRQRAVQAYIPPPADQGDALVGGVQAEDHPHRGGLARAVGPDEPGDLTWPDGERHAIQRQRRAETLAQLAHFDRCLHWSSSLSLADAAFASGCMTPAVS